MNKKLLVLLLLCGNFALAQNSGFSLKAGLQTTGITNAEIGENQNRLGFYVGGLYNFSINSNFSFQPELLYSYQSFRNVNIEVPRLGNSTTSLPTFDQHYKSHFIKVPLVVKYQPNKFYVEVGPEIGFQLSTKLKVDHTIGTVLTGETELKELNTLQIAALVGTGYKINDQFEVGLRGGWGFNQLTDNNYIKNFNISLGVSYQLK